MQSVESAKFCGEKEDPRDRIPAIFGGAEGFDLPSSGAGVFFLIWASVFLTWAPVDSLRLISGIIFVPIGLMLILKHFIGRPSAKREHFMASSDEH